jgi:hypothetical protein
MNYRIYATQNFQKEAKRLAKKYASLKNELAELNKQLLANPLQGTPLGRNAYKIRLSVKSKGKGKSGGMRVITFIDVDIFIKDTSNVFLLSIYDKSEVASISPEELKRLISSAKIN